VNPSYKLASIPRYDDIVRTAGWAGSARVAGRRPAGDGRRSQNCAPHTGSGRGRPAGDRPPTGAVLNITAAVWNAGFHWWRFGNKKRKRTQNVSEYMLVLALCLVRHSGYNSAGWTPNWSQLWVNIVDRLLTTAVTHELIEVRRACLLIRPSLRVDCIARVRPYFSGSREPPETFL